jgi:trehalose-phosphatase
MRYLFDCWADVAMRLRAHERVALFLDFDGTLAHLRDHPEEACLDTLTRRALCRVARHPRARVVVISGRRRADLDGRIGVPGVECLGLYGWEAEDSGTAPILPRDLKRTLLGRIPRGGGVWVEDKGAALAVHHRAAAQCEARRAREAIGEVLEAWNGRFRVFEGDHVWEVVSTQVGGKGVAARREWGKFRGLAIPMYVGNDPSDETAFLALAEGVTVRVGPCGRTHAQFYLRNPGDVCRFLERLEPELT